MTTTLTPLEAELLDALDEVLPFAERFVELAGPEQAAQVARARALVARARPTPPSDDPLRRASLIEVEAAERFK